MTSHRRPKTPTLAEVLEGAKRAAERVAQWPPWKQELSSGKSIRDQSRSQEGNPPNGEGSLMSRSGFGGVVSDAPTSRGAMTYEDYIWIYDVNRMAVETGQLPRYHAFLPPNTTSMCGKTSTKGFGTKTPGAARCEACLAITGPAPKWGAREEE